MVSREKEIEARRTTSGGSDIKPTVVFSGGKEVSEGFERKKITTYTTHHQPWYI
jgi:hypothetical protein